MTDRDKDHPVTGITCQDGFTTMTVKKRGISEVGAYLLRILEVLNRTTSPLSAVGVKNGAMFVIPTSLQCDQGRLAGGVMARFKERAPSSGDFSWNPPITLPDKPEEIVFGAGIALITVTGVIGSDVLGRIFTVLGRARVEPVMIAQFSRGSIVFAINSTDSASAVNLLRREFSVQEVA